MLIQKFKVDIDTDHDYKEAFVVFTGKDYNDIKKQLDKYQSQITQKLAGLNPRIRFHNIDVDVVQVNS